jgi:hypothetical protein
MFPRSLLLYSLKSHVVAVYLHSPHQQLLLPSQFERLVLETAAVLLVVALLETVTVMFGCVEWTGLLRRQDSRVFPVAPPTAEVFDVDSGVTGVRLAVEKR